MAKSHKDDIDFFRHANISAVQRVLKRARENELKHKRRPKLNMKIKTGLLDKALDLAMRHNGRTAKNQPSIRYTAPGTGGRPFHFGYTTVNKNSPKPGKRNEANGAKPGATPTGKATGKSRASQKVAHRSLEAAHQHYTERDSAVERDKQEVDPDLLEKLQAKDRSGDATDRNQGNVEEAGPEQSGGYDATDRSRDTGSQKPDADSAPEHGQENSQETQSFNQADDKTRTDAETQRNMGNIQPSEPSPEPNATRDEDRMPLTAMQFVEESGRDLPGIAETSSEAAAQRYIESPEKVAKIMGTTSSFGTIGATLEDRMDFWDLVNEHEREVDARTQSRLVVELPHEANAKHRHEIVRRFVSEFERKGIPYWASIHEPTSDNDSRNYHAHIVFTDRPMKLMIDPQTGEEKWDFTISETWKTKTSGNKRERHPYRQNRDPEMRGKTYIKESRQRFSDIVNDVMVESGLGVRYDPRSYKDMGLNVKPMNNVSRILLDKSKRQKFVVMDEEWTRRMIDTEMQNAAIRRDETYQKLQETQLNLEHVARDPSKIAQANRKLPRHLRLSPAHILGRTLAGKLTTGMLETERDRLTTLFVDEATERTLRRVIDSTAPIKGKKGFAQIYPGANAPDPEALAALHEAALEELKIFRATRPLRNQKFIHRKLSAETEWQAHAKPNSHGNEPVRRKENGQNPPAPDAGDISKPNPTEIRFRPINEDPWQARLKTTRPGIPDTSSEEQRARYKPPAYEAPDDHDDIYRPREIHTSQRPNPFGTIQKQMEHLHSTPFGMRIQEFTSSMMSGLDSIPGADVPGAIRSMLDAKAEENRQTRLITAIMQNEKENRPAPIIVRDILPDSESKSGSGPVAPTLSQPRSNQGIAPPGQPTVPNSETKPRPDTAATAKRTNLPPGQATLPGIGGPFADIPMHETKITLVPSVARRPDTSKRPPTPKSDEPIQKPSMQERTPAAPKPAATPPRQSEPSDLPDKKNLPASAEAKPSEKTTSSKDDIKAPATPLPQTEAERLAQAEIRRKRRKAIMAQKDKGFDR